MGLWEREAALSFSALYVEAEVIDQAEARAVTQISRLLERANGPLFVSTRERWRPLRRMMRTLDVHKPTAAEQRGIWQGLLSEAAIRVNGHVKALVSQFNLSVPAIHASVQEASGLRG